MTSPTTDGPATDLTERADRFIERTGKRPEEFVAAWRDGRVEDTADNARDAIEALALREALAAIA